VGLSAWDGWLVWLVWVVAWLRGGGDRYYRDRDVHGRSDTCMGLRLV
jgi:hypothetical protein